jgi:ribosomal protein L14E/L6E/L27E
VVVGVLDRNHVLLSNGSSRRAQNPKKKNVKHLIAHEEFLEGVGDAVVRVTLARLGEGERQV